MSDETVVRHEGYDGRTCLRCGKRGEEVPEGRLHYSKFENASLCRECAGYATTPAADAALLARAEQLRAFIRANASGGCRVLSFGDRCTCPLCDADALAAALRRLTEERDRLSNTVTETAHAYRDQSAEVERLRDKAEAWESRAAEHMARRYENERNAHALSVQLSDATARTTAAVEAMRERCVAEIRHSARLLEEAARQGVGEVTPLELAQLDALADDVSDLPVDCADALAQARREAVAELLPLIQLGLDALEACRDGCDWDGGDIQDAAEQYGVVVRTEIVGKQYCTEGCRCEEHGADFCYRDTPETVAARAHAARPTTDAGKETT